MTKINVHISERTNANTEIKVYISERNNAKLFVMENNVTWMMGAESRLWEFLKVKMLVPKFTYRGRTKFIPNYDKLVQ